MDMADLEHIFVGWEDRQFLQKKTRGKSIHSDFINVKIHKVSCSNDALIIVKLTLDMFCVNIKKESFMHTNPSCMLFKH